MKSYKSCIDLDLYSDLDPDMDVVIDQELAEEAFSKHLLDVLEMVGEYGVYVGEEV